ncbi:DUF2802 domain-containing protein [Vibrio sinaloensis]|uniref:DUF2802 domain-containing protein n=1 Tax=Photobacterium sp. (strain ATCC 43367) TaxID=379097 RepID=UPI00205870FF|nr:DUF2802 domain-containing protein [Vibrio sinaloensis]UPQ87198.1 DUF2802 domain-containing protein [Vibrio sinaloensis]
MDTSWMTQAPVLAGAVVLVVLLLLLVMFRLKKSQTRSAEHLRQQNRHLDKELQKANKQLLEVRSVVVGLGQKVSEQHDLIQHLGERITELEQADSDGRLYSRASKMVQLGADLDELIEECELPKAEAELMLSLQNKITGKEKIPPLESGLERRKLASRKSGGKR